MRSVLRIIDANANRAREALRVMEEAARFLLDDADLTGRLKSLRHDLREGLSRLDTLEFHRDTPGDLGTGISHEAEESRDSEAEVAVAAAKRLSEALRTIEEYAKTIDPSLASKVEAMRYRGYELESVLITRLGAWPRRGQWRVCVLLTESLCRRPWREVVERSLQAGADSIQLREKDMDDTALLARAKQLVDLVRRRASVIINDRADIALLAGAEGVHVGRDDLPVDEVRKLVGRRLLMGVSTSNLDEAQRAYEAGADYCGVGPMFESMTKHKDVIAGPAYLGAYIAWGKLPHLAIGGITPGNVTALAEVGCRGVAVSNAVCGADDAGSVVRALIERLEVKPESLTPRPETAR